MLEIEIKIESGGRNLITVTDDGNGIEKNDLELALMRHATSKLSDSELIEIRHLGFRGEALPSIAAVSRIKLSSKASGAKEAWSIRYEGGEKIREIIPCSLLQGTYIEIRDLFFATPNRLKFLKTERAETQSIVDIVNNLAMINYSIGFTLTSGNKKLLKYVKQTSLFNRLCETEEEFQSNSLEVKEEEDGIKLKGHICKPTISRGNSTQIYTFVNGRPIKDNLLIGAIRYAYQDFIPSGRYPFAVLHLEIPYDQVDVNVHPNKSEVRFQNKRLVYEIVRRGLIKALSMRIGTSSVSDIDGSRCQGIGEELGGSSFDVSESQRNNERVNNGKSREVKGRKEFYERRPSPFENQLMKEFNLPNAGEKGLSERSESFDYTGIQRLPLQAETMVLEREQIDLIEDYPLGYARCQVYNTYIIAEAGDRLIIVDQHAAYERLIYECLTSIKRQKLLIPEIVEIKNQAGMEMVKTYKDKLFEMGFGIEIESEDKVRVKEIPAILGTIDIKEMLVDIVDKLMEIEDTLPIEDKVNKISSIIACHGAGRKMKLEEMNEILRQIEKTPYSDHGRPTYIEMKLSDIEKLLCVQKR
ncbi:DNA mismatch repair endonuclease MutL [Wolbachia endosymbiont (group B) of Philonthus cognatus]|uniref:DNA mismatch repair endonuclease MutL n=1 Tax=Wolbachia endosymbiont (group B) of Philonthus cognatus TaxID=2954047 RepID=UPI00386B453C